MAPVTLTSGRIALFTLIGLCTVIEVVLVLGDLGIVGPARLRVLVYEYAGFWPGLLDNWSPNYTAQPFAMFFTYGFLHSGLTHLLVNMITLWSLGQGVVNRVGPGGFMLLYALSIMGGAIGYTLLSVGPTPMVGASGALFGLAGGLLAWMYVDRFSRAEGLLPVLQAVVLLIVLNLVLWWVMDGQLAWETHLGGFITGWLLALLIDPRPAQIDDTPDED